MREINMTYKEMMKLRSAYCDGYRTDETRAAACLYIRLRRQGKIEEFKNASNVTEKGDELGCMF